MSGITIADIEKVYHDPKSSLFLLIPHCNELQGLAEKAPQVKAVIRVMPNTPALVGAGAAGMHNLQQTSSNCLLIKPLITSVYCLNQHATLNHADITIKILESVGICHQVPESQLNAFTGLSGSGPAYVSRQYSLIKANENNKMGQTTTQSYSSED